MLLFLFALPQQLHYVARLGDLGKVDLRLHLARRCLLLLSGAGLGRKVLAYFFGFVLLDGARVGLLLRHAHFFQDVENCLALYLKLSGQIIDSNFHSAQYFLQVNSLRDHNDLTLFFA